jgi:hypothetical protein
MAEPLEAHLLRTLAEVNRLLHLLRPHKAETVILYHVAIWIHH